MSKCELNINKKTLEQSLRTFSSVFIVDFELVFTQFEVGVEQTKACLE